MLEDFEPLTDNQTRLLEIYKEFNNLFNKFKVNILIVCTS